MTVAVYTFEPDRRGEALRWTTGAAIILLAHTAFITSYIMLRQSSSNAPAEVPAISIDFSPPEVALPLPAPPVEEQKPEEVAPPPPQAEEAKIPPPREEATPQAEPPPPPKQAELEQPQDKPVAPPPPVIEKPHIEKKIEKPKTATPAKTPPTPKAAHRTAPVAPSAGAPSAASVASQADWHGLLRTQLLRNKRYPSAAASNHETGSVVVSFTLDRSGHLLSRNVVRSSGHPSLDQEALATVERSQPLPSPPAGISQASLHITVPLNFTLR